MLYVLIAFLIATPISWWLMQYAYKIDIKWWFFLFAGAIALLIAVLTVGLQALRTARASPVNAIKTE